MPDEDRPQADQPEDLSEDSAPEAEDERLEPRFRRMLGALKERASVGPAAIRWVAAWQPLVDASSGLATTAAKLVVRARQAYADGDDAPLLDEQARQEIEAKARALFDAFPEASAIFFGIDDVDRLIGEVLDDDRAREAVAGFGRLVEARMNALIARVLSWGLADGGPELSLDRLESFVRGLESLLQEMLDRWVLPRLYEDFEE